MSSARKMGWYSRLFWWPRCVQLYLKRSNADIRAVLISQVLFERGGVRVNRL